MINDKIEVKISTKPRPKTSKDAHKETKVYIETNSNDDGLGNNAKKLLVPSHPAPLPLNSALDMNACISSCDERLGNNSKKLLVPSTSAPLPMNSARMDMNTCIITIPASGLDCPSLHGKGLCISPMTSPMISPTSSARTESSYNYSQILDNKSSIMSSLHSAIYFAEEEVREGKNMDEDYCVGYSLSAELWPCS